MEEDEERVEAEESRYGDTPPGAMVEVTHVGGGRVPPPMENSNLPGFHPERAHLLLQGVYGEFLYHNDGAHLDRGIADDDIW